MLNGVIYFFLKSKAILFLCFLFLFKSSDAQVDTLYKAIPSENTVDSLKQLYGKNKVFVKEIEIPALVALSYFPDLKEARIFFKIRCIKTTMSSRPYVLSCFEGQKSRKYLVSLNHKNDCMGLEFFERLPFDAQVGVLSHELCHIEDYTHRRFWGITLFGFDYLFPSLRRKIENRTDEEAVKHGLGYALAHYTDCIERDDCLPLMYRLYKKKYYYTSSQLRQITRNWEEKHICCLNDNRKKTK